MKFNNILKYQQPKLFYLPICRWEVYSNFLEIPARCSYLHYSFKNKQHKRNAGMTNNIYENFAATNLQSDKT